MYHIRKHPISWRILLYSGDFIGVTVGVPLSIWISSFIDQIPTPAANRLTALNSLFGVFLLMYFFHETGLYQSRCFLHFGPLIRRLVLSFALFVTAFVVMRELTASHDTFAYLYFLLFYATIAFVLVLSLRVLIRFIELRFLKSQRVVKIAFIGWSFRLSRVLKGLLHESLSNLLIEGYFTDKNQPDLHPPVGLEYANLGSIEDFSKVAEERGITTLLVDQRNLSSEQLQAINLSCSDLMVSLRMIPWSSEVWTDRLMVNVVEGVPVIGVKDLRHDRSINKLLRRIVDLLGAVVGLILFTPIIAILALLIRRESPGPVFYKQTRLGLNDKPFQIIKLRSMRVDAEQGKAAGWTVENDPRRLKIGEFMRKWNLDELPQFWNVLVGEMSLVGPRPERPEFVERFRDSMDYYNLRHSCKPGITGWAAVHGLRGDTSLEHRLEYDLYYIENWSLMLDFKIMLMTLSAHKNAY